jgi:zinc transporter
MSLSQCSVYAYFLDGLGGGREIGWKEVNEWQPSEGILWLVGRPSGGETQRWLRRASGLPQEVLETMLSTTNNRPRCMTFRQGTLLTLLGMNQSRHSVDDELTTISIWIDAHRLIAMRSAPTHSFEDIRSNLLPGEGPTRPDDILAHAVQRIIARLEPLVLKLGRDVDDLEDAILLDPKAQVQQELVALRHRLIIFRRQLVPQHEALSMLQQRRSWINETNRQVLQETQGRLQHQVSDLDATRERAVLMQDEITQNQNTKLNETMKIVAVFTAYLMPLNTITSLLGTNIEGIPFQAGGDHAYGFTLELLMLVGVMGFSYFIFKKKKWFD